MRALASATVVVTAVVIGLTVRLGRQLSPDVAVDWFSLGFAVLTAYLSLGMFGWWLRDRERDRERGRAPRPVPED